MAYVILNNSFALIYSKTLMALQYRMAVGTSDLIDLVEKEILKADKASCRD